MRDAPGQYAEALQLLGLLDLQIKEPLPLRGLGGGVGVANDDEAVVVRDGGKPRLDVGRSLGQLEDVIGALLLSGVQTDRDALQGGADHIHLHQLLETATDQVWQAV